MPGNSRRSSAENQGASLGCSLSSSTTNKPPSSSWLGCPVGCQTLYLRLTPTARHRTQYTQAGTATCATGAPWASWVANSGGPRQSTPPPRASGILPAMSLERGPRRVLTGVAAGHSGPKKDLNSPLWGYFVGPPPAVPLLGPSPFMGQQTSPLAGR